MYSEVVSTYIQNCQLFVYEPAPPPPPPSPFALPAATQLMNPHRGNVDYIAQEQKKTLTLGQPSFWTTQKAQKASQEQALNVSTTTSEHIAGLFLVHSLKLGLAYWKLSLHLMHMFLANIDDAINNPVDLSNQIAKYQSTLKYARSKVDLFMVLGCICHRAIWSCE